MNEKENEVKMNSYYVILKGGKEQFIIAENPREACKKVHKLLPGYEIVGYYETSKIKKLS